ncbi:MAG: hypothetical protein HUM72_12680 [Dolichospermum sp.]|nr:hypothetical protein [Dolichospermum sp.]
MFRTTSNTSALILDFQETSEIDSIFIVDNPRNGFGISTISFNLNATSNFTSPAYTDSLTFSTVHGLGYKIFPQQNYRFARINLTSTLGYCELSKVFIGKSIDLGRGPNFNWSYQNKDISNVKENRYGQKFVDVISRQKVLNIAISLLNKDQLDQVFELYDDKGTIKPLFVSIGDDTMVNDHRRFSGMVYLNSAPTITNTSFGRYSLSLSMEEAM